MEKLKPKSNHSIFNDIVSYYNYISVIPVPNFMARFLKRSKRIITESQKQEQLFLALDPDGQSSLYWLFMA